MAEEKDGPSVRFPYPKLSNFSQSAPLVLSMQDLAKQKDDGLGGRSHAQSHQATAVGLGSGCCEEDTQINLSQQRRSLLCLIVPWLPKRRHCYGLGRPIDLACTYALAWREPTRRAVVCQQKLGL